MKGDKFKGGDSIFFNSGEECWKYGYIEPESTDPDFFNTLGHYDIRCVEPPNENYPIEHESFYSGVPEEEIMFIWEYQREHKLSELLD